MSRSANRRLALAATAALALALVLATAATASREVAHLGELYLADDGGISPLALPRDHAMPASARLVGEIGTEDGSHPPALESVAFDVDRTISVDARGLPVCRRGQIQSRDTSAAKRACAAAMIGSGSAEVEVAFEEQKPFRAKGPVLLFNGGVHGRTTVVFLHAYVAVPAPTAIVVRATVTRIAHGPFGMRVAAKVPEIAGGAGSVTRFELRIGRRFEYRGRRRSLISASCPTGHWLTKGAVAFSDGTHLGLEHLFTCTPQG